MIYQTPDALDLQLDRIPSLPLRGASF
jgi:hypothetical protein